MKPIFFFVFTTLYICILLNVSAQTKDTLEVSRYEQAAKMQTENINKHVFRTSIQPLSLLADEVDYSIKTREGLRFVKYNLKTNQKQVFTSYETCLPGTAKPAVASANAVLSPDGKKEAFICDWNLWVRYLDSGKEVAVTTDGVKDFGYATNNAGWSHNDRPVLLWSPDSRKIATFQQDQRHVGDIYLLETKVGRPVLHTWKYPVPGDERVIELERVIIDVENAKVIRLKMPRDPHRGTQGDDISKSGSFDDNEWSRDAATLAFISSTRDHKTATLRVANANTGEVRDVYTETVATQYESGPDETCFRYLPERNEFIWYSERDDWGHLYLGDLATGKIKQQITKGNFVVGNIAYMDFKKNLIYFTAAGKEPGRDPYYFHLYRIGFDGKKMELLTPENAHHGITFAPDGSCFIDTYSTYQQEPVTVLRSKDGKLIAELERADIEDIKAAGWKPPRNIKVSSADGRWDLYGLMCVPNNFDSTRKYPVINYIYPGPSGGSVGQKTFNPGFRGCQALAELGFVVVAIEGSGNPWRSKSFHDACYGEMYINTLPDQISGIRQLAAIHSFMDTARIGIYGRSGGGFASTAGILRYPDFYKVCVSFAGNHDNRSYEDDWGERYIGLMKDGNYDYQDNQTYAKNLKGKLLLVHGAMDDNVPPNNTMLMAEALMNANKDFDMIIIPYASHRLGKYTGYIFRKYWDYFVINLMGKQPPKGFELKIE